jgi:hypothetical protein
MGQVELGGFWVAEFKAEGSASEDLEDDEQKLLRTLKSLFRLSLKVKYFSLLCTFNNPHSFPASSTKTRNCNPIQLHSCPNKESRIKNENN